MRNEQVESWLRGENVPYTYLPEIAWETVDLRQSRRNQARLGTPIIEEAVERYVISLQNGDSFFAPVGYQGERGYVLIDGNHRHEASIRAGRRTTDFYRVDSNDTRQLTALTLSANLLNGLPLSRAEQLEHAKQYLQNWNLSLDEVGRIFRLSPNTIKESIRVDETRERLRSLNLALPAPSPGDSPTRVQRQQQHLHANLSRFASIRSDPALKETASLVFQAELKGDTVRELVTTINRQRSEKDQLDAITAFRNRPDIQETLHRKERGRPALRAKPSVRSALLGHLHSVNLLLQRGDTFVALGFLTTEEQNALQTQVTKLLQRLAHLRTQTTKATTPPSEQ